MAHCMLDLPVSTSVALSAPALAVLGAWHVAHARIHTLSLSHNCRDSEDRCAWQVAWHLLRGA
eukprot:2382352-Alexandrium_andersonii.AAC.1